MPRLPPLPPGSSGFRAAAKAVARDLLRRGGLALEEVAARVGYGSASTFSTAFSRHTGEPPGRFMRRAAGGVVQAPA